MRTEWPNKHVELSRICCAVNGFFKEKGFSTQECSSDGGYQITAFMGDVDSVRFAVVEIHRDDGIVVDYFPWGKDERASFASFFSQILTLFGGGILVKHDLKRKELADKIEKEFWDFLDGLFSGT